MEVVDLDQNSSFTQSGPKPAQGERRKEREPTYIKMGRFSSSMIFGSSYITGGVLSGNILEEIEKRRSNPNSIKALTELELGNIATAKRIAMDPAFIQNQKTFVASGQLLKVALSRGHLEFARELIDSGYYLAPMVLLEAISENNRAIVLNAVTKGFIDQSCIALLFWWALYCGHYDEAANFAENYDAAIHFAKDNDVSTAEGSYRVLHNPELLRLSLSQALSIGQDNIASKILGVDCTIIEIESIKLALEHDCLEFLR